LLVSIEQRERTAFKSKIGKQSNIEWLYERTWNWSSNLRVNVILQKVDQHLIDQSQWSQMISMSSLNRFQRDIRIIENHLKSIWVWILIHLNGSLMDRIRHSGIWWED
jgi:hypothetical protein